MPANDDQNIPITTPQALHQEAAQSVAQNLGKVLGSDVSQDQVIPTTAETEVDKKEMLGETANRVLFNKPGYQSSGSFLKKMVERLKKKNPGQEVVLKEEK